MSVVVPLQRTPVTMQAYARALAVAWHEATGGQPTREQAGVLWAQYGIETGGGDKAACWNFNIGNVKHVPGDGFDYVELPNTWEMIGGKRVVFQPPNPATWFRVYPSLDVAMVEHWAFLHGRYGSAWEGVELGDCGLFARRLKERGYFTADANDYAAGMRAHFRLWMASSAFEAAMAELASTSTLPAPANDTDPIIIIGGTVHPLPDLSEPDDEPPQAA